MPASRLTRSWIWSLSLLATSLAVSLLLLRHAERVRAWGSYGYTGAFALAFTGNALVATPFPWVFPIAALGTVYPHGWIVLAAALGAACGEVVPYAMGFGLASHPRAGRLAERFGARSRARKTLVVLGLAFSPVLSYPGLAAGLFRYPLWATFAIVVLAEACKVWLFVSAPSAGVGLHLLP